MLEERTRLASEQLARTMDRRAFLKRTGNVLFASLAAVAAGHVAPALALAGIGDAQPPRVPECITMRDGYCNRDGNNKDPNACHGASCFQQVWNGELLHCTLHYNPYATGCWTTPVTGGYWVCCDCECGNPIQSLCSCAQWSGSPAPRPDSE
jgi:hypothetical protein